MITQAERETVRKLARQTAKRLGEEMKKPELDHETIKYLLLKLNDQTKHALEIEPEKRTLMDLFFKHQTKERFYIYSGDILQISGTLAEVLGKVNGQMLHAYARDTDSTRTEAVFDIIY